MFFTDVVKELEKESKTDRKITSKEEEEMKEDEKGTLERRGLEQRVESFSHCVVIFDVCFLTNQV